MIFNRMNLNFVLFNVSSHPEDVTDVLVVVGESEEDWQHEEVAADDDVRFVTLCDGHCHCYVYVNPVVSAFKWCFWTNIDLGAKF